MTLQRWRSQLLTELRRQGLPSKRVDRLVEELTDHAFDLFSESQSMDAEQDLESRLGTPEQLAVMAKDQFTKSTFVGRHPMPFFVIGPIVMMFSMLYAGMIMTGVSFCLLEWMTGWETVSIAFANGFCQCGSFVDQLVALVFSTLFFIQLGRRSGRLTWSLVACATIAITPLFFTSVVFPKTEQHHGMFTVAIGVRPRIDRTWQSVIPLAFGLWIYSNSSRSQANKLSLP